MSRRIATTAFFVFSTVFSLSCDEPEELTERGGIADALDLDEAELWSDEEPVFDGSFDLIDGDGGEDEIGGDDGGLAEELEGPAEALDGPADAWGSSDLGALADPLDPRYAPGDCAIHYRSPATLITVSASKSYFSPPVAVPIGYRLVARLHRRNFSSGTANIRIQRYNGVGWVNYLSSTGSGARKLVDTTAQVGGWYRFQIYSSSASGVPTRGIFDVVPSHCTGLDTCFGASGKNCDGFPNGSCSEQSDGQYRCDITVGANMHDSCCSAHPHGKHCGGNESAQCVAPAGSSYATKNSYVCCTAEWDHAVGDAAASRLHKFLMDPNKTAYRRTTLAHTVVVNGQVTATVAPASGHNPGGIRAPAGTKLWLLDAIQGWCASNQYTISGSDAFCQ